MAAELEVFHALSLVIGGAGYPITDFDSLAVAVKGAAAEITSGLNPIVKRVVVPAGEKVTFWNWSDTDGFVYAAIKVIGGEGFIQLSTRYNVPTSDDDLTPTGSLNRWRDRGLSCVGVAEYDSERAYVDDTSASVEVSQASELPGVWASADRVLAVADRMSAWNEGTEDVVLAVVVVPK